MLGNVGSLSLRDSRQGLPRVVTSPQVGSCAYQKGPASPLPMVDHKHTQHQQELGLAEADRSYSQVHTGCCKSSRAC